VSLEQVVALNECDEIIRHIGSESTKVPQLRNDQRSLVSQPPPPPPRHCSLAENWRRRNLKQDVAQALVASDNDERHTERQLPMQISAPETQGKVRCVHPITVSTA
jgi:hypothetical protein